jgi:hypothetical protein
MINSDQKLFIAVILVIGLLICIIWLGEIYIDDHNKKMNCKWKEFQGNILNIECHGNIERYININNVQRFKLDNGYFYFDDRYYILENPQELLNKIVKIVKNK